ncbi:MAG: hypothetical protein R2845_11205 [Thermomicrobiales bacterium]
MREIHEPRDRFARHHLVGDVEIVDAAIGHRFRHTDLGARDTARSGCDLATRDRGRPVRFRMWTEVCGQGSEELGHRRNVRFDAVEIDERHRSRQAIERLPERRVIDEEIGEWTGRHETLPRIDDCLKTGVIIHAGILSGIDRILAPVFACVRTALLWKH